MAQEDVYQYLKQNGDWVESKQISEAIGISAGSVTRSLARLRWRGDILIKRDGCHRNSRLYKIKQGGEN